MAHGVSRLLGIGGGDWKRAKGAGVTCVTYTDGEEIVWRDARGRITRHHLARAGRVGFDVCFAYMRCADGTTRRVRITHEEWERKQRPRRATGETWESTTGAAKGRSAVGLARGWYESLERGETPSDGE